MERKIRKAVVIGSGVMGAGIAAHLANVGISTLLLDIVPREITPDLAKKGVKAARNSIAQGALDRMLKTKPAPLFTKESLQHIAVGNIEDDLGEVSEVDWIIEVVVENLQVKRALFEKIEQHWKTGTVVSSNTSGVSINAMIEGRSEAFRSHFLGMHFFNPPRYMKLLEIIPANDTSPEIVGQMVSFSESVLGKGVVIAKDTPNFIANRIGVYGLLATIDVMKAHGLTPDEVDSVTGPALGRPRSATFRTLDMVGLDTFVHVANNVYDNVNDEEEKQRFIVPEFLKGMVANGWIGEKSGQGFYKKVKSDIFTLQYETMDYELKKKLNALSLEATKAAKDVESRVRSLVYSDDKAGKLAWEVVKKTLLYTASKVPEISDDIVSVDQAMKWGFNWDLGPFELWDAIGVKKSVERMKVEGETIPLFVQQLLESGKTRFYDKTVDHKQFYTVNGIYETTVQHPKIINLQDLKENNRVIKSNSGASLIDIGDGIACLEFHSPKNAIGADILNMIHQSVAEVSSNYRGLVIGNQSSNFCVGANIMLILMEAQDDNWDEIDMMVRQFQGAMMALKYMDKPVVAAPYGLTLGGGVEACVPADHVQAAAETYMGLVEVGVGIIPGGGGNKEMLIRHLDGLKPDDKVDIQPLIQRAFETIGMAKVSTSAQEAKDLRYLRESDGITMNKDYLLHDAKQAAIALADAGYRTPASKKIQVLGEPGFANLKFGAYSMRVGGMISEHDEKIARKLAYVLTGGDIPANSLVSEQYLLDIEREAFLSLCGEPKTQQRMMYMLQNGKPLRN